MAFDLFGPRPRQPRRVMMHVVDAGTFPDGRDAVHFQCSRCEFDEGWTYMAEGMAAAKRGRACPHCNAEASS